MASLTKQASGHLPPDCDQEVGELEIDLAGCIFDLLGATCHVRSHRRHCSKESPWRAEDRLDPGKAPSLARGPPGN